MISIVAMLVALITLAAAYLWASGGRLGERCAPARRRKFDAGLRVSIPVLMQSHVGEPPSTPPAAFGSTLRIQLKGQSRPELKRGGLAMRRDDFDDFWAAWAQGWRSGGLQGHVIDDRYWYTAVPRRYPPNESYLILLTVSDWELVQTANRETPGPAETRVSRVSGTYAKLGSR